ncbi:hypothetical protein NUH87_30920 [Pseudomonas batumici]|uniref:hypothetical protein n=1 Tax=Pseudomonas batumici TaxID=226910 RepID=UPI0030CE4215
MADFMSVSVNEYYTSVYSSTGEGGIAPAKSSTILELEVVSTEVVQYAAQQKNGLTENDPNIPHLSLPPQPVEAEELQRAVFFTLTLMDAFLPQFYQALSELLERAREAKSKSGLQSYETKLRAAETHKDIANKSFEKTVSGAVGGAAANLAGATQSWKGITRQQESIDVNEQVARLIGNRLKQTNQQLLSLRGAAAPGSAPAPQIKQLERKAGAQELERDTAQLKHEQSLREGDKQKAVGELIRSFSAPVSAVTEAGFEIDVAAERSKEELEKALAALFERDTEAFAERIQAYQVQFNALLTMAAERNKGNADLTRSV